MPVLRWSCATARYSCFRVPVETGTPPRRRKLHILRFRLLAKAHSFRCSSFSKRTRYAGLRLERRGILPQVPYPSLPDKAESLLISLRHLCAKCRPLCGGGTPKRPPAGGCPLQIKTTLLSFDLAWRLTPPLNLFQAGGAGAPPA